APQTEEGRPATGVREAEQPRGSVGGSAAPVAAEPPAAAGQDAGTGRTLAVTMHRRRLQFRGSTGRMQERLARWPLVGRGGPDQGWLGLSMRSRRLRGRMSVQTSST